MPFQNTSRDMLGGLSAMLVAFPSSIAFGLIVFAPLLDVEASCLAVGALAGIIGSITIGLIAPFLGGAPRLVSAPCAPAAAVLAALAIDLLHTPELSNNAPLFIPLALALVGVAAGLLQTLFGLIKGGTVIKFIPYPVVAGYLGGVGCIIILSQINTLLGLPKDSTFFAGIVSADTWKMPALVVGMVSLAIMFIAPKLTPKIPAPIVALIGGAGAYFLISPFYPALQSSSNNPFVIGPLTETSGGSVFYTSLQKWQNLFSFPVEALSYLLLPTLTLAVLLSIDTLKTCVILDALTKGRHNSNRELFGQGIANVVSNAFGGMSGAGTMGATMVNVYAGGKTRFSGFWVGIFSLVAFLFLGNLLAWVPLAALGGILVAVGIRMIDLDTFQLLKQRATWLDFLVVASVIGSAIGINLMAASALGVLLAILLFLRDQIRGSVIHRKSFGNTHFSKKRRLPDEIHVLEAAGDRISIFELQGTLFFGTTDQLFTEIEPTLKANRLIILDMRRVYSVDFTAAHLLNHMDALITEKKGILLYCNLNARLSGEQSLETYLRYLSVIRDTPFPNHFNDLNEALEWAEEVLLKEKFPESTHPRHKPMEVSEFDLFKTLPAAIQQALKEQVQIQKYKEGSAIFEQNEAGGVLYLIRFGEVKIMLPMGEKQYYHITTFGRGDFFGDLSFLDGRPRSATAIAATPVELFVLSREAFDKAASSCPPFAGQFFSKMAYMLSIRLRHADSELRALEGV